MLLCLPMLSFIQSCYFQESEQLKEPVRWHSSCRGNGINCWSKGFRVLLECAAGAATSQVRFSPYVRTTHLGKTSQRCARTHTHTHVCDEHITEYESTFRSSRGHGPFCPSKDPPRSADGTWRGHRASGNESHKPRPPLPCLHIFLPEE